VKRGSLKGAVAVLAGLALAVWPSMGCPPEILDVPDDDTADDDTGDDDTGDDDTGDDDTGDDDTTPSDDADGDGYTADEGDCDDNNDAIFPGADDVCDDWDNDCDGRLNEDSVGYDSYEPNDDEGYDLGDLTEQTEVINSFLHQPGDDDHFLFYIEDGYLDWFYIDLAALSVPEAVDIRLELWLVDDADHNFVGLIDTMDASGPGGQESMSYDGSAGSDDSGTYELRVNADTGYDCSVPYTVEIVSGV
jgi:hypothetical protein